MKSKLTIGDLSRRFNASQSTIRKFIDTQSVVNVERIGIYRTIDARDLPKIEKMLKSKGYGRRETANAM